jgi:hypothetical protein
LFVTYNLIRFAGEQGWKGENSLGQCVCFRIILGFGSACSLMVKEDLAVRLKLDISNLKQLLFVYLNYFNYELCYMNNFYDKNMISLFCLSLGTVS